MGCDKGSITCSMRREIPFIVTNNNGNKEMPWQGNSALTPKLVIRHGGMIQGTNCCAARQSLDAGT